MKILVISPYVPWPLYGGSSVRIFNLLKELSKNGNKIYLIAGSDKDNLEPSHILNSLCEKVYLYRLPKQGIFSLILKTIFSYKPYPAAKFQSNSLKNIVNNLFAKEKFDLTLVNFSILADILPSALNKKIPLILDQHECEEFVYRDYLREGNLPEKIVSSVNLIRLKRFKERVFSKISAIICVSEQEADFTRNQIKNNIKVWVSPNGVSEDYLINRIPRDGKDMVVFCGNMSVRRNIDAVVWFAEYIFPLIKKEMPSAEFYIVGSHPSPKVLKLSKIKGVKVIGEVADIKEYYQKGNVFVSPYKFGAGTKLKILEAMASNIPIVSTTSGCRGISLVDGKNILIANNEKDFSSKVIKLLKDQKLSEKLADLAKDLVKEKYLWSEIVKELELNMLEVVKNNDLEKR